VTDPQPPGFHRPWVPAQDPPPSAAAAVAESDDAVVAPVDAPVEVPAPRRRRRWLQVLLVALLVGLVVFAVLLRLGWIGGASPTDLGLGAAQIAPTAPVFTAAPITPPPPAAPAVTVPVAPTSSVAPPAPAVDPAAPAAVVAWFTLVCPTPVYPPEAEALMTPAAWALLDQRPSVVPATWACDPVTVQSAEAGPTDGWATVRFITYRTITSDGAPTVRERVIGTRLVARVNGTWLVDVPAPE
jgi:hypothetical protein